MYRTLVLSLAVLAVAAPAASAEGRAVSLSDARYAPSSLAYVQPGERVELDQCGGSPFSDVSA